MTPVVRHTLMAALLLSAHALSGTSAAVLGQTPTGDNGDAAPVVVYLVRHAERADDGTSDPPLSVAGQIRVQTLRAILADAGLTHVHSTDLERTRETARPIAEAAGLSVELYDPSDLEAFADQIRETPGRHLVAGHSNTTPALVAALGGEAHGSIHEMEYDRLYVVVLPPEGEVVTSLLRFGEPYVPGEDFGLRASPGPLTPRSSGSPGSSLR